MDLVKCVSLDEDLILLIKSRSGSFSAELERLVRLGLMREDQINGLVAERLSKVIDSMVDAVE